MLFTRGEYGLYKDMYVLINLGLNLSIENLIKQEKLVI